MKNLDLYRVWEILNLIRRKEGELTGDVEYLEVIGGNFCLGTTFEDFLEYYCFRFDEDDLVVFNDDGIPYEDYTVQDFNNIPIKLLYSSDVEIERWFDEQVAKLLDNALKEKENTKEFLKAEIERLTKQLTSLNN